MPWSDSDILITFVFFLISCIHVFLFSKKSPYRWQHEWPKYAGDDNTLKVPQQNGSAFVGHSIHFMHQINAQNIEHF